MNIKDVNISGAAVKFDFGAVNWAGRFAMALSILLGRPFVYDGVNVFDDNQE